MSESAEQAVNRFRYALMRKMPFYGDIVMQLPFVEDYSVPTAATNGLVIKYNPTFILRLPEGQRNFVLMHEVFHVLLGHCGRDRDKDPQLWNVAADYIVNHSLSNITRSMKAAGIPFERVEGGLYTRLSPADTVENLYGKLREMNRQRDSSSGRSITVPGEGMGKRSVVNGRVVMKPQTLKVSASTMRRLSDLKPDEETPVAEAELKGLVRRALSQAARSPFGHGYIPADVYTLAAGPVLDWKKLLRDHLTEFLSDETSYTTPERKYLHMDLILPGHGTTESVLEEVWAFVDSSGSIGKEQMSVFLTQLYHLVRSFHCTLNLCYWDTQVGDVYKKIDNEKKLMKSVPHHSGGTDINCVYRWIRENKVRPEVMLILTDGYYGNIDPGVFIPALRQRTILVLGPNNPARPDMKQVGKLAKL